MAEVQYGRRKYVTVLKNWWPVRFEYSEIDHCCQRFSLVDTWLDAMHLQHRRKVGYGQACISMYRDIVTVVLEHLRANATVFFHPMDFDEECDEARKNLA